MDRILELIFKGLLQWLFDMIINIAEYLANSLLTIFSMGLSYFERNVPVTADIVNIMICTGWALLLGNLVFQATKSMATGLGFEGEDPRELFTRTFVMGFLLVASRQVCDIGLSITQKVINLVQVPSTVQAPQITEDMFSVPGDASWLLVIIIGIILVVQLIKLFFELGERYVIVAILTILSPLAFAMGGSKSTGDIFKGWVRMFGSMCLMMVLSIVFLKFVLSAMSNVPSGAAVLPWTIFVVAIAKSGRKVDSLIARIGLSPAITGDSLGSRLPGMLSYMVIRNMAGSIGRAAAGSTASGAASKTGAARLAPSFGGAGASGTSSTPMRPPIGSSASKDATGLSGSPASSGSSGSSGSHGSPTSPAPTPPSGYSTAGAAKASETATRRDTPHTSASMPVKEAGDTAGTTSRGKSVAGTAATPTSRPPISGHMSSKAVTSGGRIAPTSAAKSVSASASPVSAKGASADIKSSDTTKGGVTTETASKTGIPAAKANADIPLSDKIRPAMSSEKQSAKATKDSLSEAGRTTRPATAGAVTSKVDASKANTTAGTRPSDSAVTNKAGDLNQKGGNVAQSQSNATNITVQQKGASAAPSRPDVTSVRGEQGKPPVSRLPHVSASGNAGNGGSSKPPISVSSETPRTSGETSQAQLVKGSSETATIGNAKASYKNGASRPENATTKNAETSKHNISAGNIGSKPSGGSFTKSRVTSASSAATASTATTANAKISATNNVANTTLTQTGKAVSKPPAVYGAQSRPDAQNAPKANGSAPQGKPVNSMKPKQKQTSKESKEIDGENAERLRTRPPYKPSGSKPKDGRDKLK